MVFGGVGFVVTGGFLVVFAADFFVAQEVMKRERIKNNIVVALAKE